MSHTVYGNTCSYKLFQITACHNVIMTERERYLSRIFDLLAFERLCSLCDSPLVFSFAIKKIIVSIQNRLTPGDKFDIMRYTFSIKEKNTPIFETKKAIVYETVHTSLPTCPQTLSNYHHTQRISLPRKSRHKPFPKSTVIIAIYHIHKHTNQYTVHHPI